MHAKIVSIDIRSDRHGFEQFDEEFIDLFIMELLQDLRSESEVLRHSTRLVISAKHDHITRIIQLQTEEENADFKGEDASVNIIAKE